MDFSKSIEELGDESEPERTETDPTLVIAKGNAKGKGAEKKKSNIEDRLRRRKQAEAAGMIEPRTVTNVYDGGPFKEPHRMSRLEYIKKHNNLGTIGKIMRSETMRRDEEHFYKTLSDN